MQKEKMIENSPTIGLIHNISKNQMKYLNSKISKHNIGMEIKYIMMVYDNPNCSQSDLVKLTGESKSNIAKALKKLESQQLITRNTNPENRRQYMLKTTPTADKLVPEIRKISKEWEKEVGIYNDNILKEKLQKIAIKAMDLIKED